MLTTAIGKHLADLATLVVKATLEDSGLECTDLICLAVGKVVQSGAGILTQVELCAIQHLDLDKRPIAGVDLITLVELVTALHRDRDNIAIFVNPCDRHVAQNQFDGANLFHGGGSGCRPRKHHIPTKRQVQFRHHHFRRKRGSIGKHKVGRRIKAEVVRNDDDFTVRIGDNKVETDFLESP